MPDYGRARAPAIAMLMGQPQPPPLLSEEVLDRTGRNQQGHSHAGVCRVRQPGVPRVSGFTAGGLTLGEPALVIAPRRTAPNRADSRPGGNRREDNNEAREPVVLDARQTVATFIGNRQPNAVFFDASASGALEQLSRGRNPTLRAYGEIVDVCGKTGWPGPRSSWKCCATGRRTRTISRHAARRWVTFTGTHRLMTCAVTTQLPCSSSQLPVPSSRFQPPGKRPSPRR
jgi:hypothetical protein